MPANASHNLSACADTWDVIVIGGALSGSAAAIQLKQGNPELNILILERKPEFARRVGESTVEVSSYFLGRVLGLTQYLNEHHLVKQGLRFWFTNEHGHCFDSCSELGPRYNIHFPSYQVDRARLDEELLQRAVDLEIALVRPAEIKAVELQSGGQQLVTVKSGDSLPRALHARWVVDASGTARFLARKQQWVRRNERHPIASMWTRWKQVRCWDDPELHRRHPDYAGRCHGIRHTATNHHMGKGWWSWWIPLKDGDMSIGIVYDERIAELPPGAHPAERMEKHLRAHPLGAVLLENASCDKADFHWRRNLAYSSKEVIGDGFALVGDAAGFIDPFYSPGMDWIAFTSAGAVDLILKERAGSLEPGKIQALNDRFKLSYERWFEAIYENKYFYMGDYELMRLAFMLDLGLYYFGVVSQPFKYGRRGLQIPPFTGPHTTLPFLLIRAYNRRFARIARRRMDKGTWGRKNHRHYHPFVSYRLNGTLPLRVLVALARWGILELKEGWKTWLPFRSRPLASTSPRIAPGTTV